LAFGRAVRFAFARAVRVAPRRQRGVLSLGLGQAFAHQLQDPVLRVILVQHVALSAQPDQLLINRFEDRHGAADDFPLRSRGQRNPGVGLQFLQSIERHPAAVLQHANGAGHRDVVFVRTDVLRSLGREDGTTEIAAQALKLVAFAMHRGRALQSDHHRRPSQLGDPALLALGTVAARFQRFVRHPDSLGARVGVGTLTAVALALDRLLELLGLSTRRRRIR